MAHFDDGDFPGAPPGAIPVGAFPGYDEYEDPRGGSRDLDGFDSDIRQNQSRNNKKNKGKDDKKPVEVKYEGYVFAKAEPPPGEQFTWGRVSKTCLPFDDKDLAKLVRSRRQKSRTTLQQDFMALSGKQRSIIDRVIAERKLNEANKNADWVLADVLRVERRGWKTKETKSLRIIIKRQDKTQLPKESQKDTGKEKTKDSDRTGKDKSKSSQFGEIIDLSIPLKKKDNKNKNGGKRLQRSQSADNLEYFDEPAGLGIGPHFEHGPHGHNQQFPPNQQFPQNPFPGPIDVPPPPPGPGPMPFDHNGPGEFPPPPHNLPSARQSFSSNVFQPNPEFAIPAHSDLPLHDNDFPHPHHGPSARTRSHSRPRRSSTRPPAVDERRFNDLQDVVEDLQFKMENLQFRSDSSEGTYEDEIFSPTGSRGPDNYSPPSSPISQFSDAFPSGSLGRRSKSYGRDPRHNPQYRSYKYSDVDIQPGYSRGRRDSHYVPSRRRHSSRPKLTRAITMHDDYPNGGPMEPRFRPPPRPIQRRLTYASTHDFDEYDDRRPREYRDPRDFGRASSGPRTSGYYDRDYDVYERRRGEGFPERRRSVAVHPDDRY